MSRERVLLADDHPVARLGIRLLLEKDPDFVVVGEAGSGEEALRLVEQLSPDVLLLDIEMPGLSGIDVARRLCEAESPVRILVLSAHDEKYFVKELMATGVYGYLTKDDAPESIIDAVRGVARGERGWINRRVAAQMSASLQEDGMKIKDLTEREVLVLRAVVDGMTNLEIGYAQHISEKTVEKHLAKIFIKLGVDSRLDAAVHAVRQSLV